MTLGDKHISTIQKVLQFLIKMIRKSKELKYNAEKCSFIVLKTGFRRFLKQNSSVKVKSYVKFIKFLIFFNHFVLNTIWVLISLQMPSQKSFHTLTGRHFLPKFEIIFDLAPKIEYFSTFYYITLIFKNHPKKYPQYALRSFSIQRSIFWPTLKNYFPLE